jgi:hypothetical protein
VRGGPGGGEAGWGGGGGGVGGEGERGREVAAAARAGMGEEISFLHGASPKFPVKRSNDKPGVLASSSEFAVKKALTF